MSRRGSTPVPPEDRAEAVRLYLEGMTLREAARAVDVTAEAVRLWLLVDAPGAAEQRAAEQRAEKERRVASRSAARDRRACIACWGPMPAERTRTCSPHCAELWRRASYHLMDRRERHRFYQASYVLRHPERHEERAVNFSRRVMAGESERREGGPIEGSAVYEALREVERLRRAQGSLLPDRVAYLEEMGYR